MTWLLIGIAISLFAALVVVGYRRGRHIYQHGLNPEPPEWVNGGDIWLHRDLRSFIEAVDLAIWETEFPKHKDRDDPSYCVTCGGRCQVDPV